MKTLDARLKERAHDKLQAEIDSAISVYLPSPLTGANHSMTDMFTFDEGNCRIPVSVYQALYLVKKAIFNRLHEQWEEEVLEFLKKVVDRVDE